MLGILSCRLTTVVIVAGISEVEICMGRRFQLCVVVDTTGLQEPAVKHQNTGDENEEMGFWYHNCEKAIVRPPRK
jgi:hypothetical protein